MRNLFFEFKFEERDVTVQSNGRNGMAQTHGIAATVYTDRIQGKDTPLVDTVTLFPITSRGNWQNCHIDIPLADFLKLADLIRGGLHATTQTDRHATDQPNV